MNLIEAAGLSKCYDVKAKPQIYAVNNVDLTIRQGESVGLVGESGSGKSTLGKLLLQLEKATSGTVHYRGNRISEYSFNEMRSIRKHMQMIFQNSGNLFNPYFNVKQIILEPIDNYSRESEAEKERRVVEILDRVGLDRSYLTRFGHELSGGQRQRVGIARALVLHPEFVVCDEAVSSLDYVIRNQVLKLLMELKEQFGLTYLYISHDLSSVRKICDRVLVMYMGHIVEILPRIDENVLHPYTQALMGAILDSNPRNRQKRKPLFKATDEQRAPDQGCIFQHRCLYAKPECGVLKPKLENVDGSHFVACHLHNK